MKPRVSPWVLLQGGCQDEAVAPAEIWHWAMALLWEHLASCSLPSGGNNLSSSPAAKHLDEPRTDLSGEAEIISLRLSRSIPALQLRAVPRLSFP